MVWLFWREIIHSFSVRGSKTVHIPYCWTHLPTTNRPVWSIYQGLLRYFGYCKTGRYVEAPLGLLITFYVISRHCDSYNTWIPKLCRRRYANAYFFVKWLLFVRKPLPWSWFRQLSFATHFGLHLWGAFCGESCQAKDRIYFFQPVWKRERIGPSDWWHTWLR